jgi:Family of unknown function (DUF6507)
VAAHLKADLDGIGRMAGSLGRLADEFASLTSMANEAGATGNAELSGALSDFATGWSDKRNQLIGQLRELSQGASEAVREYTATDTTLARNLGTR